MSRGTEQSLLQPCRDWLHLHLNRRHRQGRILILPNTDRRQLRHSLVEIGLQGKFPESSAWEIKADVVAVVQRQRASSLVLIELKATAATLRDVGQLLGYCRVCRPEEAFLLSARGLSPELRRLLTVYGRTDILEFGGKSLRVGKWDEARNEPDWGSVIPSGASATL